MAKKKTSVSKKTVIKKPKPVAKKIQKTTNSVKFKKYQWMLYGAFAGAAVCCYFIFTK